MELDDLNQQKKTSKEDGATAEGRRVAAFEILKLRVESIKHITTLAAGTIVIIATFMDKLAKPFTASPILIIAVISMLVCLTVSFILLWALTLAGARRERRLLGINIRSHGRASQRLAWNLQSLLIDIVYFSFCLGIGSLGIFAVRNILHK